MCICVLPACMCTTCLSEASGAQKECVGSPATEVPDGSKLSWACGEPKMVLLQKKKSALTSESTVQLRYVLSWSNKNFEGVEKKLTD